MIYLTNFSRLFISTVRYFHTPVYQQLKQTSIYHYDDNSLNFQKQIG